MWGGQIVCAVSRDGGRAVLAEDYDFGQIGPPPGAYAEALRVYDLQSGELVHILGGHRNRIDAVAITADAKRAMSASFGELRFWDVETGACLQKVETAWSAHRIQFSSDGREAITISNDENFRLWDVERGKCVLVASVANISCTALAASADFRVFALGAVSGIFLSQRR